MMMVAMMALLFIHVRQLRSHKLYNGGLALFILGYKVHPPG